MFPKKPELQSRAARCAAHFGAAHRGAELCGVELPGPSPFAATNTYVKFRVEQDVSAERNRYFCQSIPNSIFLQKPELQSRAARSAAHFGAAHHGAELRGVELP